MIILATLVDEQRDGQRRAAGKKIHYRALLGVDLYNIVLAESTSPTQIVGKKFVSKLAFLPPIFEEFAINNDSARIAIAAVLSAVYEQDVSSWTFKKMDKQLGISKRVKDSTGQLELYHLLKQRGFTEEGTEKEDEAVEGAFTGLSPEEIEDARRAFEPGTTGPVEA